ncbi:hypothetical protein STEG23_001731 [Scotinomys teguina]
MWRQIEEQRWAEVGRKMGPVFVSILLTCVFLLVWKFFFNDFVEYVFCAFELVFFSFFYSYYSKFPPLLSPLLYASLLCPEGFFTPLQLLAPSEYVSIVYQWYDSSMKGYTGPLSSLCHSVCPHIQSHYVLGMVFDVENIYQEARNCAEVPWSETQ